MDGLFCQIISANRSLFKFVEGVKEPNNKGRGRSNSCLGRKVAQMVKLYAMFDAKIFKNPPNTVVLNLSVAIDYLDLGIGYSAFIVKYTWGFS